MLARSFTSVVAVCVCVGFGAARTARADNSLMSAVSPAAPPPTTAPVQKYDLRFHPSVGMKWAYQAVIDSDVRAVEADADEEHEGTGRYRMYLVVNSEEVTEMRKGRAVARRLVFGPNCWTASATNGAKGKRTPLFCSGTTVNVRLAPDGSIQTNSMMPPTGDDARQLRNAVTRNDGLLPGRPVAIGEQWRADEGLRAVGNFQPGDDVKAAVVLKGVRQVNGRDIADLAVIGRSVTTPKSMTMTITYRGTVQVDLATGILLKADLGGRGSFNGTTVVAKDEKRKDDKAKGKKAPTMSGSGKASVHIIGYLLAAPGLNTQPQSNATAAAAVPAAAATQPAPAPADVSADIAEVHE
jgi:hypothetical protein